MMILLAASDPTSHILPHDLFKIGPIYVNNQMVMAAAAAVLMILIFPALFRRATGEAPTGARNFFELILEFLRVEVFRPALKEHTDRFVPFLWTVFFFILFCNLLGFIPFGEVLGLLSGGKLAHYGGTATGSLSTNVALAATTLVMIHLSGIVQVARDLIRGTYGHHEPHEEHSAGGEPPHEAAQDLERMRGEALAGDVPQHMAGLTDVTRHYKDGEHVGGHVLPPGGHAQHAGHGMNPMMAILMAAPLYLWNFAPHPFRPEPGQTPIGWLVDVPIWAGLLGLELIGAIIKPFALMIRLFANMIAGHLVLAVLVTFIPVTASIAVQIAIGTPVTVLSLLIRMLELFVCFLQAYIFTFLATLFIASAVAPEH